NNSYVRSALVSMNLPPNTRMAMQPLTDKIGSYKLHGYRFDELYSGMVALATYIYKVRKEVYPYLKNSLVGKSSGDEKILQMLAVDNLKTNMSVLADDVSDLYLRVVQLDKDSHQVKRPVYERMPELQTMGQLLTSD
nr:hypothetical protein [Spirochaetaceae bacterium]